MLDAEGEALGSLCYREGEVAEEMRWHMWQVVPPRLPWLARAREALGRAPRWRVAGLVHVYLAPHARGTPAGAELMRGARRRIPLTFTLILTLTEPEPEPEPEASP